MKINIIRKSLIDPAMPLSAEEYITDAVTVGDFIAEMTKKNHKSVYGTIENCIEDALDAFAAGAFYILNRTHRRRYIRSDEKTDFKENDELVLIKLKYVRGIVW